MLIQPSSIQSCDFISHGQLSIVLTDGIFIDFKNHILTCCQVSVDLKIMFMIRFVGIVVICDMNVTWKYH